MPDVCPVEAAGGLDNRARGWLQNPTKILRPYVKEGMTALDIGCGPGFFTVAMAQLVGTSGRVIAADLQQGMLARLEDKLRGTELADRVILHKCEENTLGLLEGVDFALAFYMVHEVPDQGNLFKELAAILRPNGQILVVEPPFHTSKAAFEQTIEKARDAGLVPVGRPRMFPNKTLILEKS